MVKNKADIQKAKRKAKKKEQRQVGQARLLWQKADGLIDRARFLHSQGELQEALTCYRGALKAAPRNHFILRAIAQISLETGRSKEAFAALTDLEDREKLPDHLRLPYGQLLADRGRFEEALGEVRCFLQRLSRMAIANKKAMRAAAKHLEQLCAAKLASPVQGPPPAPPPTAVSPERQPEPPPPPKVTYGPDGRRPAPLPPIGVELAIDRDAFVQALVHNRAGNPALLALALEGYRLRFREAFENLICLPTLNGVRSLWYQEETA
jgi:tetratricopeptide (TPR) repeat protein